MFPDLRLAGLSTAAFLALAAPAFASQITLSESTTGYYSFSGTGSSSLNVKSNALSGAALFGVGGTYTLGSWSWFTTGKLSGGNFPVSGDQSFSFLGNDGDKLSGTVDWSLLKDDSPNPDLIGTLAIGSSSGDATFTSTFAGATSAIDLVFKDLSSNIFLSSLSTGDSSETAVISSGEVIGSKLSPVSEPGTLALLSSALLGLGFLLRRGNSKGASGLSATSI